MSLNQADAKELQKLVADENTCIQLSHKKRTELQEILEPMIWLFVDEAGMLTASLLLGLSQRLREFGDPKQEFGGFNVLLIGDFKVFTF